MFVYLCGPVDFTEDSGALWRRKLAPFLRDQLGHRVYDPTEVERRSLTGEEIANLRTWQTTDLEKFRRASRKIIASNLDLIEHQADYLICYWDAAARTAGDALAGITAAHRKGIPVYLVTSQPAEEIDRWALGCSDQVFASIENLKAFLVARFSRDKQTVLWRD